MTKEQKKKRKKEKRKKRKKNKRTKEQKNKRMIGCPRAFDCEAVGYNLNQVDIRFLAFYFFVFFVRFLCVPFAPCVKKSHMRCVLLWECNTITVVP